MLSSLISKFNIKNAIETFNKHQVEVYAANAAFWLFISLIPLFIGVISLIPYTPLTITDVTTMVNKLIPKEMQSFVLGIFEDIYSQAPKVISFSFISTIIASEMSIIGIIKGLNCIEDVEENRNFIMVRIRATFYTVITMVVIVLTVVVGIYGGRIYIIVLTYFGFLAPEIEKLKEYENLIITIPLFILFLFLYCALPAKKMRIRDCIPGAIFTALVWLIMTYAFSLYFTFSTKLSIYGSLSQVVALMLYFNIGMYVLFIGAGINQFIRDNVRPVLEKEKNDKVKEKNVEKDKLNEVDNEIN